MIRALPLVINLAAGLAALLIGLVRDDAPTWPGIVASAFSALEGRRTSNTSERR